MIKLTFYGGVKEIGGNKILLEDNGTRIFLDFGMNFEQHARYFTEYMPPRKCSCISDLIRLGLLPDINGIYRKDYCKHMGLDAEKWDTVDGVLITHAHIDHLGYVHFLRNSIPIHVSRETKAIMDLFTTTGSGGFNEYSTVNPSFQLISKKKGEGMKRRDARDGLEERSIKTFESVKKFKIGNIEIAPYRVDHSLPGATGFIIYTSEGPLIYTGDLRFHGRHGQWTQEFVERASAEKPEIMISEGTRINEKSCNTEDYVQKESTNVIRGKEGLVIVNFPMRDTDRLLTFYNTAKANNRKLVIEARQALLLDLLHEAGVGELPRTNDENIRIFFPKRGWGLIGRDDFRPEQVEQDYHPWEKKYLSAGNIITAKEISEKQEEFVMFLNYFQLNNLLDMSLRGGSVHIRSICEPFSDDMEIDQKRVDNWLRLLGLYPGYHIHSSGHAPGHDIIKMIGQINPKNLIPIHTTHPEMFSELPMNKIIVERGKTYNFGR